eukprot:4809384-Amphidinium_carterae.1
MKWRTGVGKILAWPIHVQMIPFWVLRPHDHVVVDDDSAMLEFNCAPLLAWLSQCTGVLMALLLRRALISQIRSRQLSIASLRFICIFSERVQNLDPCQTCQDWLLEVTPQLTVQTIARDSEVIRT